MTCKTYVKHVAIDRGSPPHKSVTSTVRAERWTLQKTSASYIYQHREIHIHVFRGCRRVAAAEQLGVWGGRHLWYSYASGAHTEGKPLSFFLNNDLSLQREQAEQENTGESQDIAHQLPALLRRRYRIYIHVTDKHDVLQIRNIRAANIGSLVKFKVCTSGTEHQPCIKCLNNMRDWRFLSTFQGICTRVGDVKPLLEVACFTCDCCGFEIYQVMRSHIWYGIVYKFPHLPVYCIMSSEFV